MRQSNRRRLNQLAATGFALGIGATFLGLSAPAGVAAEVPKYSASSSANLLHVSALDTHPLGIDLGPLIDLKVSTAGSKVDSTKTPRTEAAAAHLDLGINKRLPDVPNASIKQTAPPDNAEPTTVNGEPLNIAGLAKVGIGTETANARWNEGCEKGSPTGLTNASTSLANAALLPGAPLSGDKMPADIPLGENDPVLELPDVGLAASRTDIVDVPEQSGNGVQSQARISLAELILFKGTPQQITIKVISQPTLTVTAAGSERSNVKYEAPILEVVTADGTSQRIDDPHTVLEVPLAMENTNTNAAPQQESNVAVPEAPRVVPDNAVEDAVSGIIGGLLGNSSAGSGGGGNAPAEVPSTDTKPQAALLRLSIGDLQKSISSTNVKAEASSVRLQVLDVPGTGTLLDVALGQLKAEATVPDGGLNPGDETPNPTDGTKTPQPTDGGNGGGEHGKGKDGSLPVTGSNVLLIFAAGLALVIAGRVAMVIAKRKATPAA